LAAAHRLAAPRQGAARGRSRSLVRGDGPPLSTQTPSSPAHSTSWSSSARAGRGASPARRSSGRRRRVVRVRRGWRRSRSARASRSDVEDVRITLVLKARHQYPHLGPITASTMSLDAGEAGEVVAGLRTVAQEHAHFSRSTERICSVSPSPADTAP
jgi:hypothetical protein